jgi:hypothetical protein
MKSADEMIKATIVADSLHVESGKRITTYVCTFPRIVLAEFVTHGLLPRNSASSRAIPAKVMLENVTRDTFFPLEYQKSHTGMQGSEIFEDRSELDALWQEAFEMASKSFLKFNERGVSKQICNRLLEPFMYTTVIVTASEYENFFNLRAHPDAEIHIQNLAYKMKALYETNVPVEKHTGDWHIPFYETILFDGISEEDKKKVAVAMCAAVSYNNHGANKTLEQWLSLYDRLSTSKHLSPLTHLAQASMVEQIYGCPFKYWQSYRHQKEFGVNLV